MQTCSGDDPKVCCAPESRLPYRVQCPQFRLQAPIPGFAFQIVPAAPAPYAAGNQRLRGPHALFPGQQWYRLIRSQKRGGVWSVLEQLTAAVADMQDVHRLVLNREQNPIHVRFVAIEQMAHFKGKDRALRS